MNRGEIPDISAEPPTRGRGWTPMLVALGAYAALIAVVVVLRADPDPAQGTLDFRDYWRTALHFRETGEISSELGVHNYLPFFTIFMAPWSLLPLPVAAAAFALLSLGLFALSVALVETLLNGEPPPRPRAGTWVALLLVMPYVHSCLVLGAIDLLVLFLVVAAWFLLERRHDWLAGTVLGLAALLKLLPAVLLGYLLLTRRWRALLACGAALLLFGFLTPVAGIGFEETIRQHEAFLDRAAKGHSARQTIYADKPIKAKYTNNSLPIVLRRLLSPVNGDPGPEGRELYVNVTNWPADRIWIAYWCIVGGFGLAAGAASLLRAPARRMNAAAEDVQLERTQFGLWCCLMLIASPLLWTRYLLLAYWPLAWVTERALHARPGQARARAWCGAGLVIWGLGIAALSWTPARAAGAQIFSVVVLAGVLVPYAWKRSSPGAG